MLLDTWRRSQNGSSSLRQRWWRWRSPRGPVRRRKAGRPSNVLNQRLLPLFELAGVVFTDADEGSGRLVVGVLDRGAEGLVRAQLARLGVPSESVDLVETDSIYPVLTLRDSVRPVVAGVQIRFSQYVCSLGFNAVLGSTAGYVTASHCSTSQGTVDGTEYYQPLNRVPEEFIGTEVADPAFFRGE